MIKKMFFIILTAIFLLSSAAACQKQTNSNTGTPKPIDPLKDKKTSLHDNIIKGNYIQEDDPEAIGKEWIKMWLDSVYADFGVNNVKIDYECSAIFDQFSHSLGIQPYQYSVEFTSEKEIIGAVKGDDEKSRLKVLAIAVLDSGRLTLSGFLGPEEFDEYAAGEKIYNVVAEDPRYSSKLKPFPSTSLPKEFSQIDMSLVSPSNNFATMKALSGNIIAAIYNMQIDTSGSQVLGVDLFNLENKKMFKALELGEYNQQGTWIEGDKLVIRGQKINSNSETVFSIGSDGTMTFQEYPEGMKNTLYSPDKSKYAYTEKGSIYLVDTKNSSSPRLLLKGNYTEDTDVLQYYPFSWLDNTRLIYEISGWEWSCGCGIFDIENGTDTFFEQAGSNSQPYMLINSKLYTITGAAGENFDPGVMDLNNKNYPWRKVFKDRSFIENNYFEGYALSPDGSKVALLKGAQNPYEKNVLYICSAEDGTMLKSYGFVSGFSSPQYMDYLEDGRILIYSQRYAYNPGYIYIVNTN